MNERQATQLTTAHAQFDELYNRFQGAATRMENQHEELKKWELRKKSIEEAEFQKDETEKQLILKQETIDEMRGLIHRMDERLTVVEEIVKDRDKDILERDAEAEKHKVEVSEMLINHAAQLAQLELVIVSLHDIVDDLVEYQLSTAGVFYSSFNCSH